MRLGIELGTMLSTTALATVFAAGCTAQTSEVGGGESDVRAGGGIALATELPEQCKSAEIYRVDRPVASDDPKKGHFSYGFRFKAPTKPGAPVFVYAPGGPGDVATDAVPEIVPEGWGYLLTDPRGVGCNTPAAVPEGDLGHAFFRTEEIARDVVAAIQDRHVDDYVLYGLSYGTLLATTVAYKLEQGGLAAPRAVVLEGVLGRAYKSNEFAGAEYIRQWDRVRHALPADVITELDTKDSPYGIDQKGWSNALMQLLPASPGIVAAVLTNLSTTAPADARNQTLAEVRERASSHSHDTPGAVALYRDVSCREIMDTVPLSNLDVAFDHGKLVRNSAEEGTMCQGLHVTTPYDSAKLPFSAKTYYFIGEDDVATPSWQGAYHFEHHAGPAVRVVTRGGGHNSLKYNQAACAPKVMTSIAAGGADLAQVLATCPMPVQVDAK